MAYIKLNQPDKLPEKGLTAAQFKPWKNHVLTFLDQDDDAEQFLPGGRYDSWLAASSTAKGIRGRIVALYKKPEDDDNDDRFDDEVDDLEAMAAANKKTPGSWALLDQGGKNALKSKMAVNRLKLRNKQLQKTLQMLSSFVFWSEADSIVLDSTSVEWVFAFLRKHYNIESRGVNFLKIVKITYKTGDNAQTFYKQFRAGFVDNLRKAGDARSHLKPGDRMPADEALTPSFEDAIILWTLEKIDPRLPARVAKDYEHRLDKDTHLIDLQSTIFQAVPAMLESLDRDANLQSIASSAAISPPQPAVGMSAFYQYQSNRGGRGSGGRGQNRGGRGRGAPRTSSGRTWTTKYCSICRGKGKSEATIASHDTVNCDSLSKSDLRAMLSSLQAMDLNPNNLDEGEDAEEVQDGYEYNQEDMSQGLETKESS